MVVVVWVVLVPPLSVFVTHVHKALFVIAGCPRLACMVFFFLSGCLYAGLPLLFFLSYLFLGWKSTRVLGFDFGYPSWFVWITLMKSFACDAAIVEVTGWIPNVIVFRRIARPLSSILELTSSV